MDSIGDYLYIVILVVVGLSGLLKKRKKPNKVDMPPSEMSDFEEFEQMPEYKAEKEIKQEMPEIPAWERSKAAQKTKPDNYLHTGVFAAINEIKRKGKPVSSENFKKVDFASLDEEVENDFELELDSADDFKKAVIYSEILNRKY